MKRTTKKRRRGRKYHLAKIKNLAPAHDLWGERLEASDKTLIIACGALANEITVLIRKNGWSHLKVRYLPAKLHNEPQKITEQLQKNLRNAQNKFSKIYIGYADCGTGGQLDKLLEEFGVVRLPGAHCYEFFSGSKTFSEIVVEEIGSYFLTDFLVKSFESLIWRGMKIDQYPELLQIYFEHYRKLVYLAQTDNPELQTQAQEIAERLKLKYEYRFTGYGELAPALAALSKAD
ncbi:MAG: DUF1638 domain-containing protein [SAR324 cluster bacterium]|nr:DUF1638 domain-containing protein [SAR324 cluster bacterium]MBL7035698.1 DUF1638 domain-containing protein [SAR324 cluster bacterium]